VVAPHKNQLSIDSLTNSVYNFYR